MENIPALTVKQPWARLIMLGIKNVENRSWTTDYRGRIFVHAGVKWDPSPWPDDPRLSDFGTTYFNATSMPAGVLLGTVDLYDIAEDSTSPWARKGDHHWLIRNPQPFSNPVPWRGQMGLWWPTRFKG
jgi:hypothetical protein